MTLSNEELLKREIATLTRQLYDAYRKIKELQETEPYGDTIRETSGDAD